jgi:uncharacterized protein YcnI
MVRSLTYVCGILAAAFAAGSASAHVTLETAQAQVGGSYKAVFRVGHGCSGSPTVAIRVKIPAGMIAVKPMPKPGWKLDTVTSKYDKPVKYFDSQLTEGVSEVSWSGGKLLDAHYDEFILRGAFTRDLPVGKMAYFPLVQECEKGIHRWIEIPVEGKPEPAEPAPGVKLTPAGSGHH